jgi:hypothetical protein
VRNALAAVTGVHPSNGFASKGGIINGLLPSVERNKVAEMAIDRSRCEGNKGL